MAKRKRKRANPAPAAAAKDLPDPAAERAWRIAGTALALVALATYVSTLGPTTAGGDSSELILAAHGCGPLH